MRFFVSAPAVAAASLSVLALLALAAPTQARDSLGVFGDWGAFRDAEVPRCYAIAAAQVSSNSRDLEPFASVGTWPDRQVRGQIHFRLSREMRDDSSAILRIGTASFDLTGSGGDAWAADQQMDAQIIAAIRAAGSMQVSASDSRARRFTDRYALDGAATAMDAATVACSQNR